MENTKINVRHFGCGIVIVAVICLVMPVVQYFFLVRNGFVLENIEELGQFGDSYGVLNAIFTGMAFVGVLLAFLQQRDELQMYQAELKDTRKAMREQASESYFLGLLRLYRDTVAALHEDTRRGANVITGELVKLDDEVRKAESAKREPQLDEVVKSIYPTLSGSLGYFRAVTSAIKETDWNYQLQQKLSNTLWQSLSVDERRLILYSIVWGSESAYFRVVVRHLQWEERLRDVQPREAVREHFNKRAQSLGLSYLVVQNR